MNESDNPNSDVNSDVNTSCFDIIANVWMYTTIIYYTSAIVLDLTTVWAATKGTPTDER